MSIINEDGAISLAELSKINGKSELENAKMVLLALMMRAEFYGKQTIQLTVKNNEVESDNEDKS